MTRYIIETSSNGYHLRQECDDIQDGVQIVSTEVDEVFVGDETYDNRNETALADMLMRICELEDACQAYGSRYVKVDLIKHR